MSRQTLRELVEGLGAVDAPEDGFLATRIHPGSEVRVGRSRSSIAVLVPALTEAAAEPDLRLANLTVTNFAQCSVVDGSDRFTGSFGIIECTSHDHGIQSTFLDVVDWLLPDTGDVTTTEARDLFQRVIRLLSAPDTPARTSTLGLWGELFVIGISGNVDEWARGWHVTPRDRWDFAFRATRVEVKSSSGGRRHHFSLDQLQSPDGTETLVVSILTTASSSGPSIRELLQDLVVQVGPTTRPRLIETAVASLGSSWSSGSEARFDDSLAADSLRVYSSRGIPQVGAPPPEVSEVRFVVDLSDVDHLGTEVGHVAID